MHSSHSIPTNLVYSILKFTLIVFIFSNLAVSSPVKVTNISQLRPLISQKYLIVDLHASNLSPIIHLPHKSSIFSVF